MKQLFDDVSYECSKITTKTYSTSFSLGIRFLGKQLHNPIYAIYGFVRFADEIVDSFHEHNKRQLLQEFKDATWQAIERKISMNPILNSFQYIVNRYGIEDELILRFFESMESDLEVTTHTPASYQQYILGSAEVVGLMCLRVFVDNDAALYDELKPSAMKLGAAFQKVNFLRDINADYKILGRTYFPDVNFERFSSREKEQIQKDIEADFVQALAGIKKLPLNARRGVYLAYFYYRKLFQIIKKTPAERVMSVRIRIPNYRKISLMCQSVLRHQLNML
jgi:phytoene/squalene synthetase